jgi:hypothetical protein
VRGIELIQFVGSKNKIIQFLAELKEVTHFIAVLKDEYKYNVKWIALLTKTTTNLIIFFLLHKTT